MNGRIRSFVRRIRNKSPRQLAQYAAARLFEATKADERGFPLLSQDVADSTRLSAPRLTPQQPNARPRIAWVTHPPSPGSGGHTTLFRMVAAAAASGYDNTLLLYNRHAGDIRDHAEVIRHAWPWLDAAVEEAPAAIRGYDALVASSWSTAHVIASRASEGRRLYFIQDYEPFFSPRGSEYAYAEDSYRLGFRNLALGGMVHALLRDELGVGSDLIPFGADTSAYVFAGESGQRRGVGWYARRRNDRRGYDHAVRALTLFHRQCPAEPIHIYGDVIGDTPFPAVNHGSLSPVELNALYNSVVAGLALSFTNVSLVPEEMLAAGAIPVVNEDRYARMVLDNPHAVWARATPGALADALAAVIGRPDRDSRAATAAASVAGRSWAAAGAAVLRAIAEEIGPAPAERRADHAM
ncbi:glycosyltransferase family 1 protein [Microbacterium sp. 18062]|uniref:rhamnosyltransferase WsaF family glycosyltransferase n=1 Tax=Microbacterium sp. 18062 TaxID=2681410 RepID=UPI00135CB389|nr:glycosyltransferase family 1 protein [Microbacterium sp. 18062]